MSRNFTHLFLLLIIIKASTICKLLYVNGRLRLQDLREWVAENDGKPKTSMLSSA